MTRNLSLVSFGDRRFSAAKRRLARQARQSRSFQNIWMFGEKDLDSDFYTTHRRLLDPSVRGFGYWMWKPQVIKQALSHLPEHNYLLYLDAGCHIWPEHAEGFGRYLKLLEGAESKILCGETSFLEAHWTKGDLFQHFRVVDPRITDSPQRQAGVIFLQKTRHVVGFVDSWLEVMANYPHLVDDSPSISPNLPGFVENRHDQSVFSILSKLDGATTFPDTENLQWVPHAEKLDGNFPVQARRDTRSIPEKMVHRVRKAFSKKERI